MRLFQAALDTCLDSPFFASLSVHGLHFTVYLPSKKNFWGSFPRLRLRRALWATAFLAILLHWDLYRCPRTLALASACLRDSAAVHIIVGVCYCQREPHPKDPAALKDHAIVNYRGLCNKQTAKRPAERGHVKKCQKLPKEVSRQISTVLAQGKKHQKIVKEKVKHNSRHFSATFARHHFSGHFLD